MPNSQSFQDPRRRYDAIVIAQVSRQVRESIDKYIGQKSPNESERAVIERTIYEQIKSISPDADVRVETSSDAQDPSLINVDVYYRNTGPSFISLKNIVKFKDVEIEGEMWTKFSIQA